MTDRKGNVVVDSLHPNWGLAVGHGRVLRLGQVWQHNDPRVLRAVRIIAILQDACYPYGVHCICINVQTGRESWIATHNFTVGQRGWSLLKEVHRA